MPIKPTPTRPLYYILTEAKAVVRGGGSIMHIELNTYYSIIGNELKYTHRMDGKLYAMKAHAEDKIDAFRTLNDWLAELSELARVANSESPKAIEAVT